MKQKRTLIAIMVGLLSYFAIRYTGEILMRHISPPGQLTFGVVASTFINMLIELLPGFIAGWISCNRGLISGFVVGLFGSCCYSALLGTAAHYFPTGNSEFPILASWFLSMGIVAGVFGAMAGGIAQLMILNNPSKRSRSMRSA